MEIKTPLRAIRSFARRGRLTVSQKQALAIVTGQYLLKPGKLLDFTEIFARSVPRILEIGFGMGDTLVAQAQQNPEQDYLGIDVHEPGIGAVLAAIEKYKLTNIRLFHADAVEILAQFIPYNSLDGVQIFFSDPWPKRRHHKRRLIQPAFIGLLYPKIKVGGKLHLATDWEDYAQHMLKVMSAATGFENLAGENQFSPRPNERPLTKFEKRGQRLGHSVWDLLFTKI